MSKLHTHSLVGRVSQRDCRRDPTPSTKGSTRIVWAQDAWRERGKPLLAPGADLAPLESTLEDGFRRTEEGFMTVAKQKGYFSGSTAIVALLHGRDPPRDPKNADLSTQYLVSFYWVIASMMAVGYGDIFGTTDSERMYSIMTQLLGAAERRQIA